MEIIRSLWNKLAFWMKLRNMDYVWYNIMGGNSYGVVPPSYYYKYSEEEVERIKTERIDEMKQILRDFELRHEMELKQEQKRR